MTKGQVKILSHKSEVLVGNPLGDPSLREVYCYTPPHYSAESSYPALLLLSGFSGTGSSLFNRDPFVEDLNHRFDRLIQNGDCPPFIAVAPDCFTRFGGSQYLNSSATGRYEDYLLQEILPFIESQTRVKGWSVAGKSSGGYGAIRLGLKHPNIFKSVGMHSGDCLFELCYLPDFGKALTALRTAGGPQKWLEKFWKDTNRKRKGYLDVLNILAMAACYSPNPEEPLGIDFPFDLETGVFQMDVWKRWQANDPYHLVDQFAANSKKISKIFIDCGNKDEFFLQWGARSLAQKLQSMGASVVHEEFDDGHMSISYRFDRSVPILIHSI